MAAGLRLPGGRLVTVLGVAGDRLDEQIREMGHLAGHGSDDVVIAQKEKYLRGRSPAEMAGLLRDGVGGRAGVRRRGDGAAGRAARAQPATSSS